MARTFNTQWVIGKTVAKVELNTWRDQYGAHHDPVIVFTDGSMLAFGVSETESGDGYGVQPIYVPANRSKHAPTKEA